jgi:GNAT superfamily N-acetyltransferase
MKIRRMTTDDIPLGLRLVRQAGWNQMESDWRRFLSMEPEGCFVADMDGASVGTTTTCIFDGVAWIAMVLVDKAVRGRGIGTGLLKHALDYLKERNVRTVRLDATPAGRPIYEKLGFVPEYELARYQGTPDSRSWTLDSRCGTAIPSTSLRTGLAVSSRAGSPCHASEYRVSDIIELDRRMTGTNRQKMLSRLFEEFPELAHVARQGNQVQGYIAGRPGANATQVGPCIATAGAGPSLLSDSLSHCVGRPVFVDVPLDNAGALRIAEAAQLTVQRCFTRMCLGERINDNVQAIWASSGPEKG